MIVAKLFSHEVRYIEVSPASGRAPQQTNLIPEHTLLKTEWHAAHGDASDFDV